MIAKPPAPKLLPILTGDDIVRVRQRTRELALEGGFGLIDQTKLVTAASELARNTLEHGGGGEVEFAVLQERARTGLRLTFTDRGPGIPDLELALKDGFSTGGGLGLGLSGSRRLCNEFEIESKPNIGTRVSITRWR